MDRARIDAGGTKMNLGGTYAVFGTDPPDPLRQFRTVSEAWNVAVCTPGAYVLDMNVSGMRVVARVAEIR